jgi:DNA-binding NtrC family response regulator
MTASETLTDARVLIVEDEFLLADDLAKALRKAGGEPVGPVSTIRQAEELIKRERVDAAIVDLNLHGEMASEFAERLASRNLPCLIVSGYAHDGLPETVSTIPRIEKPVSPDRVLNALRMELARSG